jgi:hypothetical protein
MMAPAARVLLVQSPQKPDDRLEQHGEGHRPLGGGDAVFDSVSSATSTPKATARSRDDSHMKRISENLTYCTEVKHRLQKGI